MSNPFALFMNLLPKQVKYLAKITAVYTDGTAMVLRINGVTTNIVKGGTDSYNVDDYVFITDGLITSKLPSVQAIIPVEVP
jgi:hypothetical protein